MERDQVKRGHFRSLSRRDFIKCSGLAAGAVILSGVVGCGSAPTFPAGSQSAPTASGKDAPKAPARVNMEEILEAAKKEGLLVLYSSRASDQENPIVEGFKKKYGVEVELYRAGGEDVTRKYELEVRANQHRADFINHSDGAMGISLARRNLAMQGFVPPSFEAIPKEFKDAQGQWVQMTAMCIVLVYNSQLVKDEEAPKSWKDLLDPKWKGKAAVHSPFWASDALYMAEGIRGLYGWDFFKKLKANEVMEVNGAGDVENLLVGGERLVGTGITNRISIAIGQGRPIKMVWPEDGGILNAHSGAPLSNAPHPNAAKLFYEYLTGLDAAKVYVDKGNYSLRTDGPTPPNVPKLSEKLAEKKVITVSAETVLDKRDEIKDNWRANMG